MAAGGLMQHFDDVTADDPGAFAQRVGVRNGRSG
jgi:hypothetical protein